MAELAHRCAKCGLVLVATTPEAMKKIYAAHWESRHSISRNRPKENQ